jgi:isopentenyl-diphosphate Delta-isomerase
LVDPAHAHAAVSFESEQLILVDPDDREIGHASKATCHDGHGQRHRAFSLFIFNERGELLLQQRSRGKRLWPGHWANSCCSHPRHGESMTQATERRLQQELGMSCEVHYLFKFEYQADYHDLGAEHELCWVYIGTTSAPVRANVNEVESWRFVLPADLDREIASFPERFTPWLKIEWRRLRGEFNDRLP